MKTLLKRLLGSDELEALASENRLLRQQVYVQSDYIRRKTNQLLMLMGTLPARPEEFDDQALVDRDPIGTITEALSQILEHEKVQKERLMLAREKTQAILSSVGVGILVLDGAMTIQSYNQRLLELFGVDEQAIAGRNCCQAVCGVSTLPANCTAERILLTRRPFRQPDWVRNGRHYEVAGAPIRNRFGEVAGIVLAYTDVTERVETVQRLRERELAYLGVLENCQELIQSVLPDGSFLFVNRIWREVLGYPPEALNGLKLWNIIAPDHRKACLELFEALMHGQGQGEVQTVFFSRDGSEIPVTGHVSCSFHNGKPQASIGLFRVTEDPQAPKES